MKNNTAIAYILKLTAISFVTILLSGCATAWVRENHATCYNDSIEEVVSYNKTEDGGYSFRIVGNFYKEGVGVYNLDVTQSNIRWGNTYSFNPDALHVYPERENLSFVVKDKDKLPEFVPPVGLAPPEIKHRYINLSGWNEGKDVVVTVGVITEYSVTGKILKPFAIVTDVVTSPFQFVYLIIYPPT